jgi:cob(I)alamin adenosyltransferase
MPENWELKEEHQAVVERSIEFISDEFAELQEALHCPNSFIVEISNKIISEYKTNQTIIRRDEE